MDDTQTKYLYVLTWNFVKSIKDCYLPIVNSKQIDIKKLVNSINLIYLKTNLKSKPVSTITGYYGHFIVNKVILKDSYNYDIPTDYSNTIIKDNSIYTKMINHFNLCDINNLIFVKFNSLYTFSNVIKINDYKKLCENYGSKLINMPSKLLEDYNIYDMEVASIIKTIENSQDSESEHSDDDDDSDDSVEDENMIKMDIPILWIPCMTLITNFNNKTIKRPLLISHYKTCEKCEITDNNKFPLDLDNKINLQIIGGCEQITNLINNYYQFAIPYKETETNFKELDFDENKINIVYYQNEDELYDKCIFIVKK